MPPPLQLQRLSAAAVLVPPSGRRSVFIDEFGHLCVKDEMGTVAYAVLTTQPPRAGAALQPPEYLPMPVALPSPPAPPPEPEVSLWDHLRLTEPDIRCNSKDPVGPVQNTLEQKARRDLERKARRVRDTARRLVLLGRYLGTFGSGSGVKDKGVVQFAYGSGPEVLALMCVPKDARVWWRREGEDKADLDLDAGYEQLALFETHFRLQAEAKAREEVVAELVTRKLRRVMRLKARVK